MRCHLTQAKTCEMYARRKPLRQSNIHPGPDLHAQVSVVKLVITYVISSGESDRRLPYAIVRIAYGHGWEWTPFKSCGIAI